MALKIVKTQLVFETMLYLKTGNDILCNFVFCKSLKSRLLWPCCMTRFRFKPLLTQSLEGVLMLDEGSQESGCI